MNMVSYLLKKKNRNTDLFAAIDIGGSKVCCAIARVDQRNTSQKLRVIGVGLQLSRGVKNGVITNLEELEDSILNAVHSAEQMAGVTIEDVYVNLAASCVQSHTLDITIPLNGNPVDESHIRQMLALGRSSFKDNNRQIVHVLPIAYAIDDEAGIRDPRGLVGEKLEASLHIVSTSNSVMQNLINCIGRCHLDVLGFVASAYASGLSTLVEDELELGVTVIDIGGSQCSIASFLDGALVHVDAIALGGAHITNDIARGLSTSLVQAERLKTLYGSTILTTADDRENILVPQLGEGSGQSNILVPKSTLTHIVRARSEEIFEYIWRRLQQSGMDRLVCQKIVITGGGSQLPGIRELAAASWNRQIRIGSPVGIVGGSDLVNSPMFATCAGMLLFALRDYLSAEEPVKSVAANGSTISKIINWVRDNL